MSDYPAVIALIITYRRKELALVTIESVKRFVKYPNIGFHIADDGSGEDYVQELVEAIGGEYSITSTNSDRRGVGANMNAGMEGVLGRADLWLHLEDDWALTADLDLVPCVRALEQEPDYGMVRLGRLTAGLTGRTISIANKLWWALERGSDTYVFTGNAALRHRRFREAYGPYREDLTPGKTELTYCGKYNSTGGPGILWPAWLNYEQTFQHIGDHQSFKYYMEREGMTAEQAADMWDKVTA